MPIRLFVVGFVIIFILLMVSVYVNRDINTYELEGDILLARLLYSEDCLGYSEEGRVYTGVVDVNFFDETNIDTCLVLDDEKSLKIGLVGSGRTMYLNKEEFEKDSVVCLAEEHPSVDCYEKEFPVLYYSGDELKNDILEVFYIKENE